jgi:hypothetical protein
VIHAVVWRGLDELREALDDLVRHRFGQRGEFFGDLVIPVEFAPCHVD